MIDVNAIILIVPPILTAGMAYLVARKKNVVNERVGKAKIDAEIQSQALTIVRGVMTDMRDEFRRELEDLKKENISLRKDLNNQTLQITSLQTQLSASGELINSLKHEITTLQITGELYRKENERLKNK